MDVEHSGRPEEHIGIEVDIDHMAIFPPNRHISLPSVALFSLRENILRSSYSHLQQFKVNRPKSEWSEIKATNCNKRKHRKANLEQVY